MSNEIDDKVIESLSGAERSAILLMGLGEEEAAAILQHMSPKEVQKIGLSMASLSGITKPQLHAVVKSFYGLVRHSTVLNMDGDDYVRNVLVRALGEDKAGNLIDRILLGGNIRGLEAFKWMDPRAIADIIRNEHPQIMAIVLSFLEHDQAAEVLAIFPEPVRVDVILRIATLEGIQPSALQELNEILEKQFAGNQNVKSSSVGGIKTAANILNFMDSSIESEIVESIKDVDGELADSIQDLMFVFDNLVEVDDRGIQALLREVSTEDLVLALKGSSDELKGKIYNNMSKRAAEMLQDDLEGKGPVKLSDVESAQKSIVAVARRMAESGEITLASGGDEFI